MCRLMLVEDLVGRHARMHARMSWRAGSAFRGHARARTQGPTEKYKFVVSTSAGLTGSGALDSVSSVSSVSSPSSLSSVEGKYMY